jgi:hypothetical protein
MTPVPLRKTSTRTPALPGFGVSGLCKMQGLRRSRISFERVQMGPGRGTSGGCGEACRTPTPDRFAVVRANIGLEAMSGYLNAFKWSLSGSMLALGRARSPGAMRSWPWSDGGNVAMLSRWRSDSSLGRRPRSPSAARVSAMPLSMAAAHHHGWPGQTVFVEVMLACALRM